MHPKESLEFLEISAGLEGAYQDVTVYEIGPCTLALQSIHGIFLSFQEQSGGPAIISPAHTHPRPFTFLRDGRGDEGPALVSS